MTMETSLIDGIVALSNLEQKYNSTKRIKASIARQIREAKSNYLYRGIYFRSEVKKVTAIDYVTVWEMCMPNSGKWVEIKGELPPLSYIPAARELFIDIFGADAVDYVFVKDED